MLKAWIIEKLGGFPTIESALAYIRQKDDDAKYEILRMAVKDLFLAISPEDILRKERGVWFFANKPLSRDQMLHLQAEVQSLKSMKLWPVLRFDVRYQLSRKMFEEGKVKDDFVWGQLATFLWDIMKTRLDKLEKEQIQ